MGYARCGGPLQASFVGYGRCAGTGVVHGVGEVRGDVTVIHVVVCEMRKYVTGLGNCVKLGPMLEGLGQRSHALKPGPPLVSYICSVNP